MHNQQFDILLKFFKALANESRLTILGILANRECSLEELAVLVKLKQPTVSHHLMKLKKSNLVSMRYENSTYLYQLDREVINSISQETFTPHRMASLVAGVENIQAP
jgi:DNA-binding transcriptional ArsR family regulator